jgi:predicted secreted protein
MTRLTFAFEEYGVQDGSGFPYANRFYIDTANDSFLPGSPIRVRIDDDTATVEDARAQARRKAKRSSRMPNSSPIRAILPGSIRRPNCRPIHTASSSIRARFSRPSTRRWNSGWRKSSFPLPAPALA